MYHSASIFKTGRQMKYPPWEPFCKIMCTRCNLVLPVKKKKTTKALSKHLSVSHWDELALTARIRHAEKTEKSPSSFFSSWVQNFDSITGCAGHRSAAQEKQSHPEQQFWNEGLGAQRKILIATRLHTLSTLLRPWRANGKIYGELSKPSECFFQSKLKCSCWHSCFQSCTTAVQLDATRLPVLLLKSFSSAKPLRHKQWPQAVPSPSQACSHVSNRHL